MLTIAVLVLSILLILIVYALFIETRMFRAVHLRMNARNFDGKLSILHISDFHFRKGEQAKLRFLKGLHNDPVDMVVVTGDMIEDNSGIDCCVEALSGFKTRLGVFAVFGAHDHWDTRFWNVVRDLSLGGYRKGKPNDFDRLKRELERASIICLENGSHRITLQEQAETVNLPDNRPRREESQKLRARKGNRFGTVSESDSCEGDRPKNYGCSILPRRFGTVSEAANQSNALLGTFTMPSGELWIVGVDDIFAGLDDFQKALAGVPTDAFRILLTHTVESPEALTAHGFNAIFAGHSHGGQVRLPLIGAIITRSSLQRKYASGSFEVNGTVFHLNNGIGTGKWTGFRFLCPPEATYIELTGAGLETVRE